MYINQFPTKAPTPGEWKVIAFCLVVVFIGLGAAGLVVASLADPAKAGIAVIARVRAVSAGVLGLGVLIGAGWMIVRRLMS